MRYIRDTECGTQRMIRQVMHFGGFFFQVQLLLRLFLGVAVVLLFVCVCVCVCVCACGVEAGLFPFLFLQGFEANIVLVAPHHIPEITMLW
jgi:hypothetical protein